MLKERGRESVREGGIGMVRKEGAGKRSHPLTLLHSSACSLSVGRNSVETSTKHNNRK